MYYSASDCCAYCGTGLEVIRHWYCSPLYCSAVCKNRAKKIRYKLRHGVHSKNKETLSVVRKEIVLAYKLLHPCSCGETDPACLQFHHRNPVEKSFTIAHMTHHGITLKKLKDEILKCDVVCANCHLKYHATKKNAGVGIVGRKSDVGSRRRNGVKKVAVNKNALTLKSFYTNMVNI